MLDIYETELSYPGMHPYRPVSSYAGTGIHCKDPYYYPEQ